MPPDNLPALPTPAVLLQHLETLVAEWDSLAAKRSLSGQSKEDFGKHLKRFHLFASEALRPTVNAPTAHPPASAEQLYEVQDRILKAISHRVVLDDKREN